MAGKIFINYRRDDSAAHALNVAQYLERVFGSKNVFIDVDRLRAGQSFPTVLEERLGQCRFLLTIIGPSWTTIKGGDGEARLDDPEDWVRLEIVRAIELGVTIIPVLVGGAAMPKATDLPEPLRPLTKFHAAVINTNTFRSDMAGLANDIRGASQGSRSIGMIAAAVAGFASVAGAGAYYLGLVPGQGPDAGSPSAALVNASAPAATPAIASAATPAGKGAPGKADAGTQVPAASQIKAPATVPTAKTPSDAQRVATLNANVASLGVQFIPSLQYRTGAYATNGVPLANGQADYFNMLNARDGGINGVRLDVEGCETGFATDKGVECYERLKNKGPTGAAYVDGLSTGITMAITDKATVDKIPVVSMGFGRADYKSGAVFPWNFSVLSNALYAADIILQHIAHELGGESQLRGKSIALLHHDSPFGKEPIPHLEQLARQRSFSLLLLPVTHPGVEQKSQWLRVRQSRPDYVIVWGWGVMNPTALKEASAAAFPREKMIGMWWAGSEPDVQPAGPQAIGYKALALQHGAGEYQVHAEIKRRLAASGMYMGERESGQVLYSRGIVNAMLVTEAIRTAQQKFGLKPLTGEQVRWGLENLMVNESRLKTLGFDGMLRPIRMSCADHVGTAEDRIHQWDGKQWKHISGWYSARLELIDPLIQRASAQYASEKGIKPRNCAGE